MKRVLVTGAAGLIGGEVAARLVAAGHRVTAMVNRHREVRGNDGRLVEGGRLLPGDFSQERFGWDAATWADEAQAHDVILHCAAVTQFDAPEAVQRAVNVEGTGRLLTLARTAEMKLVHVSTAYVCGMRDGPVPEGPRDDRFPLANGYEASKAEAETLVRASGVPAVIARPSVVVGDWATGAIRSFDTIYAAFRLLAEGRVGVLVASPHASVDFVPIDHVAAGLVEAVERIDEAAGRTLHLVSGAPVPVAAFRDAIAAVPHFAAPVLVDPATFDPKTLPPLERRLHTRVTGLYASYFQRDPRFNDTEARRLTGRACPPTDAAFLRRLIDHAIDAGFLPSAPVRPRAARSPLPAA